MPDASACPDTPLRQQAVHAQDEVEQAMERAVMQNASPEELKKLESMSEEELKQLKDKARGMAEEQAEEARREASQQNLQSQQGPMDEAQQLAAQNEAKQPTPPLPVLETKRAHFSPAKMRQAEMEISSVFSGVLSSMLSNLLTQNPDIVRKSLNAKMAQQRRKEL